MKKTLVTLMALAATSMLAAVPALADNSLGNLQESIGIGKVISIGLNPSPTGSWSILSVSDPSIMTAKVNANNLLISGLSAGTATAQVCPVLQSSSCLAITVTVSAVLGVNVSAHPAGTWVLQNKTIYYVSTGGLIPVPSWKIFLSNGGKSSKVVPANSADTSLPLLSLMVAKDSRVK